MSQDFSEIMSKRSDIELIEIVKKNRDQYQPEAIEAAEAELKKRDLSLDKVEVYGRALFLCVGIKFNPTRARERLNNHQRT